MRHAAGYSAGSSKRSSPGRAKGQRRSRQPRRQQQQQQARVQDPPPDDRSSWLDPGAEGYYYRRGELVLDKRYAKKDLNLSKPEDPQHALLDLWQTEASRIGSPKGKRKDGKQTCTFSDEHADTRMREQYLRVASQQEQAYQSQSRDDFSGNYKSTKTLRELTMGEWEPSKLQHDAQKAPSSDQGHGLHSPADEESLASRFQRARGRGCLQNARAPCAGQRRAGPSGLGSRPPWQNPSEAGGGAEAQQQQHRGGIAFVC